MQIIHKKTRILVLALQDTSLSHLSVDEGLSWKEGQHTKRDQIGPYSLLGILGVSITPIYGEGTGWAFKRLMDESGKLEKRVQEFYLSDSRDDKKRVEVTKGGLLRG